MRAPARPEPPTFPRAAGGVRATARVVAAARGGVTTLPVLDGDGPFEMRRLRSPATEARVCVVGAMAAPLGGDRLRLDATAQQGSSLSVTSAAATLALPGPTAEHATYDVYLTVGERAHLRWLPRPVICVAGSTLHQTWVADLAPSARLVLREEQVLGRTGERSGRVMSRLTVRRGGRTLLDQQADYGPGAPGWDGPAVLASYRAIGQLLIVDPAFEDEPAGVHLLGSASPDDGQAVLSPLAGPGALVTAIAPDRLRLRRLLDAAHVAAGDPHRFG